MFPCTSDDSLLSLHRSRRHGPRAAFTLIELLIVIAILSLLAAILFPVFAQGRAKARQAACLSNMKQLMMAVLLYAHDNDDFYVDDHAKNAPTETEPECTDAEPPVAWIIRSDSKEPDSNGFDPNDDYLLKPYLRSPGVMLCPSQDYSERTKSWSNYAINGWKFNSPRPDPDTQAPPKPDPCDIRAVSPNPLQPSLGPRSVAPKGKPMHYIDAPSGTIFAWEHNNDNVICEMSTTAPFHWDSGHSAGLNIMFCDGHVKRYNIGQIYVEMFTYWKEESEP